MNLSARASFAGEWLVCFAVKEEAQAFLRIKQDHLRTLVTGMGRANAERAVQQTFQKTKPSLVLTCGFAGGLDPALPKGAVLFETEPQSSVSPWLSAAGAKSARFHCANRVAITAAEKQSLRQATGADAVEMESAHIRAICRELAIPSATVRVILDAANEDLPIDFNVLMKADHSLDFKKLALQLLKSPRTIKGLLDLQKESRQMAELLASVLQRLLV
jgi:adenosylhomocysteine nucleosidase